MISSKINKHPFHKHSCPKCKFLFGITVFEDNNVIRVWDVYQNCEFDGAGYLVRFGTDDKYTCFMSIEHVFQRYAMNINQ